MATSDRLMVIAIDGPAGAGKSTVAKLLARQLGLRYLDTGAMYRCVALKLARQGVGAGDPATAQRTAERVSIEFLPGNPQRVLCDGEDVTEEIRLPEIGDLASAVSTVAGVRTTLVQRQREIVGQGGIVLEGRDAGTVIAPEADVKVFLTATPEERARRRWQELQDKGVSASREEILRRLLERDHQDRTRQESPLRMADDAVLVETDGMTVGEVVQVLADLARRAAKG